MSPDGGWGAQLHELVQCVARSTHLTPLSPHLLSHAGLKSLESSKELTVRTISLSYAQQADKHGTVAKQCTSDEG